MTHSSPSSTAEVLSEARSEPESGSLKPWHQRIEPFMIPRRFSFFCSSVPHWRIVGPTRVSPTMSPRRGASVRATSSASTTPCILVRPLPPSPFGAVPQLQPPPPHSLGHYPLTEAQIGSP